MGSSERGLTLVEVIVTLALLGMALGAIGGMIQATFRAMGLSERTLEVQQNARVAVDRVVEELRWGEEVLSDPLCGGLCPDRLTVRVSPHNPRRPGQAYVVTFRRDQVQRELERRLGPAVNNLAGTVEQLTFRYFDRTGAAARTAPEVVRVEILVITSSASSRFPAARSVSTDVFLRNHPPGR